MINVWRTVKALKCFIFCRVCYLCVLYSGRCSPSYNYPTILLLNKYITSFYDYISTTLITFFNFIKKGKSTIQSCLFNLFSGTLTEKLMFSKLLFLLCCSQKLKIADGFYLTSYHYL